MKLKYAEDVNYWKTGTTAPDAWIDKAKNEIAKIGGQIVSEAFGGETGRAAYMLQFQLGGESYRVIWPVLESKTGNTRSGCRRA